MVRIIYTGILILVSIILQTSVFGMISFTSATPNLLLIVTFAIGLLRGKESGIFTGLFSGLLIDILSGGYVGFFGIIYLFIGLFCGILYQKVDSEMPLIPLAICVISELFYHLYVFIFRFVIRGRLGILAYLNKIIMPELIATILVGIVFYGLILVIENLLENYEKRSALKFV